MPTFSWNSVPGTTRYALYVLDTTANTVLINTTVVGNSYVATAGLTPGDSFSWYIGAVGTNGSGTVFNATPQNFTLAALAVPVPVNPLSGTVLAATGYDQPTFSWQAVTGANHYSIVVSDTTSGALIAYANVAGTTFTPATVMTPGDTFVWYVGAVGANGMGIDYDVAAAPTFTLAPLAAPAPLGPITGLIPATAGYDQPTFSWTAVTGTTHYALVVVDTTANAATTVPLYNTSITGTSFVASAWLDAGHSFVWYVGAVSNNGLETVYDVSTPQTFTWPRCRPRSRATRSAPLPSAWARTCRPSAGPASPGPTITTCTSTIKPAA